MKEYEQQLQDKPELNELEDGSSSQKDTSAPPTASTGTPQPRIRLINNSSANNTNGGQSSAARSEDGDD